MAKRAWAAPGQALAAAVAAASLATTAAAQVPRERPVASAPEPTTRPVQFGLGAGLGPGNFGHATGWWTHFFGAARFTLSRRWSALIEAGLAYGWSSVAGQVTRTGSVSDGTIELDEMRAPLSQEYRATAFVVHGLFGYDFGSAFGVRAGPFVGYAVGTMRTDNCGDATYRGVPAGFALVPTFYLWRGFELGVQGELGFMPMPVCEPGHKPYPSFPQSWSPTRTPDVTQSHDPVGSAVLRLAYIGF